MMQYQKFLESKALKAEYFGIPEHSLPKLNSNISDWQARVTNFLLRKGRAAAFLDTGLGKTRVEFAWADAVYKHTGARVLILTPLAVAHQFIQEAKIMGLSGVAYRRDRTEISPDDRIVIANCEMLEHFNLSEFGGVALDESSILKNYMGKTKQLLVESCATVPFRLAATATPSPNDTVELGNHAEWLGIMKPSEMLTRWFINDTTEAQTFRLKRHGEADFWRWVSSWAVCASKPSDIPSGTSTPYADTGYVLPPLNIIEHIISTDQTDQTGAALFRNVQINATSLHSEKRRTALARAQEAAAIVATGGDWCVWVDTDYEAEAVMEALKALQLDPFEVRGSMTINDKEEGLKRFTSSGGVLVTKPSIAGFGLNWQHCHQTLFMGLSYSYEAFYQAVRRFWRFGQKNVVNAHIVMADTEHMVLDTVKNKQAQHENLKEKMVKAMSENSELQADLKIKIEAPWQQVATGQNFTLYNGDCCQVVPTLQTGSVDFSIFSPPFSNLYSYSASYRDMGNTTDDAEFFEHFNFLIPELLRVTKPGRLCAVHVKNLPIYKSREGFTGIRDFRGECIRAFTQTQIDGALWSYHSEVCIWTDPVREMQRTKAQGLLYKQLKADSSHSRQGMPEYVVLFRKWTPDCAAPDPVTHTPEELTLDEWQKLASPVWFDINRTDVLNAKIARHDDDEKHLAPLQLEVIRRSLRLWTKPGDLVLSPFAGIGSEGYVSLEQKRRFLGVELKQDYFKHALTHLEEQESRGLQSLF